MRLFGSSFNEFRNLPQVSTLPPNQAKTLYDQINDISVEMPWSAFSALPMFIDSSLEEITQAYKFYLNDRMNRIAQLVQQQRELEDGKNYVNRNITSEYNNLSWLNERPFSTVGGVDSYVAPPHLLLESGDDILLEDFGLILTEAGTP